MTVPLEKPLFLMDEHGEKSAVLLPIAHYKQLLEHGDGRATLADEPEVDKLRNLVHRPHVITGDPEDLPDIHWEITQAPNHDG